MNNELRFHDFLGRVEKIRRYYKWRYGQALFNALSNVRPQLAEEIRGTPLDPFHVNEMKDVPDELFEMLEERWSVK